MTPLVCTLVRFLFRGDSFGTVPRPSKDYIGLITEFSCNPQRVKKLHLESRNSVCNSWAWPYLENFWGKKFGFVT